MVDINLFGKIEKPILRISILLSILFFISGMYSAFLSPADYQQQDFVRIMYVHVPSAWMGLGIYVLIGFSSIAYIIWRNPFLDMVASQSALIGAAFTLITLVTGALWGESIWGTWWVWDARLTSMLILFFFYLAYISLSNAVKNRLVKNDSPAVLAVVGLINIPIVKFSVNAWSTLHQPASILRLNGPTIHYSMLLPLCLMFSACITFFIAILILRIKTEVMRKKILRIQHISST